MGDVQPKLQFGGESKQNSPRVDMETEAINEEDNNIQSPTTPVRLMSSSIFKVEEETKARLSDLGDPALQAVDMSRLSNLSASNTFGGLLPSLIKFLN